MRTIIRYLSEYIAEHYNPKVYLAIVLWILVLLVFNYSLDFEDSVIDDHRGKVVRALWFFLFYGIPYYTALWLDYRLTGNRGVIHWRPLLGLSLGGLAILSLNRAIYYQAVCDYLPEETCRYAYRVAKYLGGVAFYTIPIVALGLLLKKWPGQRHFGLGHFRFDWRPYLFMMAVMLPLIAVASFMADLSGYYPIYQKTHYAQFNAYTGWPPAVSLLLFEIAYGGQFLYVELLFRGVFVVGMIKVLGKHAVLPMVTMYVVLHFGKPLSESISSIFGGYILGVFAYKSKSIWGGVAVHVAIAWMMEWFGFLQS